MSPRAASNAIGAQTFAWPLRRHDSLSQVSAPGSFGDCGTTENVQTRLPVRALNACTYPTGSNVWTRSGTWLPTMTRSWYTTGGELCVTCLMSEMRSSPSVNETTPASPNERTGLPSSTSRENRRCLLFRKTRTLPPSRQNAVPRSFQPLPDKIWPSLYASPSNRHSSLPVSASSAALLLYGVVTYNTPSIMRGVASKKPGVVPNSAIGVSQCFHCQATCRR